MIRFGVFFVPERAANLVAMVASVLLASVHVWCQMAIRTGLFIATIYIHANACLSVVSFRFS